MKIFVFAVIVNPAQPQEDVISLLTTMRQDTLTSIGLEDCPYAAQMTRGMPSVMIHLQNIIEAEQSLVSYSEELVLVLDGSHPIATI